MVIRTELFAATHDGALRHADALDAGREPAPAPRVEMASISPFDIELLGGIAARAVRFGTGDLELAEVDLDHEGLVQVPSFLCEVLIELGSSEDPELVAEVAQEWAATEDMGAAGQDLLPLLRSIIGLVREAERDGLGVYQWGPGGDQP